QTIKTAIVSPNALDTASTMAAMIPGIAFLKTTFLMVSHFVAPNESDASRSSFGMVCKTSTIILTISGNIITANTIPPAKTVKPVEKSTKKGATYFWTKGTTNSTPHTPYITGGIPANMLIIGKKKFLNRLGAYSET